AVAHEWEQNGFIRIWRGLDPQGADACLALGEPATLILLGEDYDGGKKAWVRWADGSEDIVPGSQLTRWAARMVFPRSLACVAGHAGWVGLLSPCPACPARLLGLLS